MSKPKLPKNVALEDYLKANPDAKYDAVVVALPEFTYTKQEVSVMRSKLSGPKPSPVAQFVNAQKFVGICGDTQSALDIVTLVEQLGGCALAKEWINAIPVVVHTAEVEAGEGEAEAAVQSMAS